jgi:ADP-L-glycero-D-manno-heptose 6-epimerase
MPEHLKAKYQYYTCADMTKLQDAGYDEPVMSLRDAVADDVIRYLIPDKYLGDWE